MLLKQLTEATKKVSNSDDEVKEQYSKILQVRVLAASTSRFSSFPPPLKFSHCPPLQENLETCSVLGERFAEIEKKRSELAVYLCEDANQLSLEELFGTISTFRDLFIKSLKVIGVSHLDYIFSCCDVCSVHKYTAYLRLQLERAVLLFGICV